VRVHELREDAQLGVASTNRVFSLFHGNVKKCVFNMLGLGWFRMKEQISAFSE
jgi:hypothetical protein